MIASSHMYHLNQLPHPTYCMGGGLPQCTVEKDEINDSTFQDVSKLRQKSKGSSYGDEAFLEPLEK